MRKIFVMIVILFVILAFNIYGLEMERLTEEIQMMIIRETARSDDFYQNDNEEIVLVYALYRIIM